MSTRYTNKLIHESSPYLIQHAHNPVDWYPWGEEALQRAKRENKPLLISIGYAACHWCHVMERESFEDVEIAAFMNAHFINIKIDREERPDIDHIYMDAVQAISGSGGWPLNVFCTPDTKPFFGGTYFPSKRAYSRISWIELLQNIQRAWQNEPDAIEGQATKLLTHLSTPIIESGENNRDFTKDDCHAITKAIMQKADIQLGGFGAAPKFPQTLTIRYLLGYAHFFKDEIVLNHASWSLKQLIRGGIYDHIGGGMSRYSTDDKWLVPHFEKMLYDNALLITALCDAFQLTGDKEFKEGIDNTISFLLAELKSSEGGFYSAIDADSEGEEGKFYVWSKVEIEAILEKDAEIFCKWYGVTQQGNWEGSNILNIHSEALAFCEENNISIEALKKVIAEGNSKLLYKRNQRQRPLTDDKILLGWNALLITSFCRAFAATGNELYRQEGLALYDFIVNAFYTDGIMNHSYKAGHAKIPAFLDDYAFWIEACIHLQEISGNQQFIKQAEYFTLFVEQNFSLEASSLFSFTPNNQKDILYKKTEFYDGALPSGNSTMVYNLHYLGIVFSRNGWSERASLMLASRGELIVNYPVSFSLWSLYLMYKVLETYEIVITGGENDRLLIEVLSLFLPNKILQSSLKSIDMPLFIGKEFDYQPLIYFCRNSSCLPPVKTTTELSFLIN